MYSDQQGIVRGDGRTDYSARLNGRYNMWDGVAEISMKAQFRQADRDKRNGSYTFQKAIELNPTIPLWDPENPSNYNVSGPGMGGNSWNPVADIEYKDYSAKDQWFLGDATLKLNLMKGLSVQGTMGLDLRQYQYNLYYSQKHNESVTSSKRGKATHESSKSLNKSFEAYANYMREFGDHFIDAVAGYSFYENEGTESFEMTNANFTVDGIGPWDMSAGTDLPVSACSRSSDVPTTLTPTNTWQPSAIAAKVPPSSVKTTAGVTSGQSPEAGASPARTSWKESTGSTTSNSA